MAELILHIGMPKTGTTSLQHFLLMNREKLATCEIDYPVFTDQPGPIAERNGDFLERYVRSVARKDNPIRGVNDIEENLTRLRQALSGNKKVLLTDEMFAYPLLCDAGRIYDHESFWNSTASILEDAGTTDATIVVYLRRQDDWAASKWRQDIMFSHDEQSLSDYCSSGRISRTMDYAALLVAAEGAFQVAPRIIVRRYDRGSFAGGDIYHDFFAACGIPWDEDYVLPKRDLNASLSFDVAEALRRCFVPRPLGPYYRKEIIPLTRKFSDQAPDAPGTTPFDEEATRALMEPYLEGNRWISEKYFDGEPLFSDEYGGRPVWVPDEERIAEYRSVFQQAIRQYDSRSRVHILAAMLPESIKRPLRAVRDKVFDR